jgi:hypothetical protein
MLSSQHAHKIAFGVVTMLLGNPPVIQMNASAMQPLSQTVYDM